MSFFKKTSSGIQHIIVGLGNPDSKYKNTRHNAGFIALDRIAADLSGCVQRVRFRSLTAEVRIDGTPCLLMKPTTYMNNSGLAVMEAVKYYKIPMERVIVLFDDISLSPGQLRIRRKGTHGGHNGIKSIIEWIETEDFPRIKLGIGAKPHPDYDLADWVLSVLSKQDREQLDKACALCPDIVRLMIAGDIEKAMGLYNS